MNRQNRQLLKIARIVTDYALFISMCLIVLAGYRVPVTFSRILLIGASSSLWILLMAMRRIYSDTAVLKYDEHLSRVISATLICGLVTVAAFGVWPDLALPLSSFALMLASIVVAEAVLILITRQLMVRWAQNGRLGIGIALVGITPLTQDYAMTVRHNLRFGHRLLAVLGEADPNCPDLTPSAPIEALDDVLRQDPAITRVIIGLPAHRYGSLESLFSVCEHRGVEVTLIPDDQRYFSAQPSIDIVGNVALMSPMQSPLDFIGRRLLKRSFDVLFSLLVLILGSPVYLCLALAVKLSSPGPIFFVQERIGRHNTPFKLIKFRSMRVSSHEGSWSPRHDQRITPIGHWLRKLSLDELPQFFNVLKGDMSVVGPRPERPQFVDEFSTQIPKYRLKHRVKPGITGLAQINGFRGDTSIPQRIQYDLAYIERWTFFLDLTIILRTVLLGFLNPNES